MICSVAFLLIFMMLLGDQHLISMAPKTLVPGAQRFKSHTNERAFTSQTSRQSKRSGDFLSELDFSREERVTKADLGRLFQKFVCTFVTHQEPLTPGGYNDFVKDPKKEVRPLSYESIFVSSADSDNGTDLAEGRHLRKMGAEVQEEISSSMMVWLSNAGNVAGQLRAIYTQYTQNKSEDLLKKMRILNLLVPDIVAQDVRSVGGTQEASSSLKRIEILEDLARYVVAVPGSNSIFFRENTPEVVKNSLKRYALRWAFFMNILNPSDRSDILYRMSDVDGAYGFLNTYVTEIEKKWFQNRDDNGALIMTNYNSQQQLASTFGGTASGMTYIKDIPTFLHSQLDEGSKGYPFLIAVYHYWRRLSGFPTHNAAASMRVKFAEATDQNVATYVFTGVGYPQIDPAFFPCIVQSADTQMDITSETKRSAVPQWTGKDIWETDPGEMTGTDAPGMFIIKGRCCRNGLYTGSACTSSCFEKF